MSLIRSKFVGGVLDGEEAYVDVPVLRVSVKDGKRHFYEDRVIREWEMYERRGSEMVYMETKRLW